MNDIESMGFNPDDYCSTSDAARVLGVSLRTIQTWVESGALHAWKTPGGHRRITVKSLKKMIDERLGNTPPPTATNAPVPGKDQPYKVLMVDDDHNMLRLLKLHLSGWDLPLALETAVNGVDGLLKIGKDKPDLLITDLTMPEIDGFGMIRTLRENPLYAEMPIIVISGLDESALKTGGLPRDIPSFTKPVPFDELYIVFAALLRKTFPQFQQASASA